MPQPIWSAWTLLGLSAIASCAGNLLLKQANLALPNAGLLLLLTSPWFIIAITCYLFDLVFFTQALQQLSVSAAVPMVSGIRIAATAILAAVFFREHFTFNQLFASSLIIVGIVIMSRA
ncbi:MAG: DMT family transporter [Waterburya sp.]